MASNAKVRERSKQRKEKYAEMLCEFFKKTARSKSDNEERRRHYVGGGQEFTRQTSKEEDNK